MFSFTIFISLLIDGQVVSKKCSLCNRDGYLKLFLVASEDTFYGLENTNLSYYKFFNPFKCSVFKELSKGKDNSYILDLFEKWLTDSGIINQIILRRQVNETLPLKSYLSPVAFINAMYPRVGAVTVHDEYVRCPSLCPFWREISKMGILSLFESLTREESLMFRVSSELNLKISKGGAHYCNKGFYKPGERERLYELDFNSFYPSILVRDCSPVEFNSGFSIELVRDMLNSQKINRRGHVKLFLNTIYGLLGCRWSSIYSPWLMFKIAIIGQSICFQVVKQLSDIGCKILKINTDGIMFIARDATDLSGVNTFGYSYTLKEYDWALLNNVNNNVLRSVNGTCVCSGFYKLAPWKDRFQNKLLDKLEWCIRAIYIENKTVHSVIDELSKIETVEKCRKFINYLTLNLQAPAIPNVGDNFSMVVSPDKEMYRVSDDVDQVIYNENFAIGTSLKKGHYFIDFDVESPLEKSFYESTDCFWYAASKLNIKKGRRRFIFKSLDGIMPIPKVDFVEVKRFGVVSGDAYFIHYGPVMGYKDIAPLLEYIDLVPCRPFVNKKSKIFIQGSPWWVSHKGFLSHFKTGVNKVLFDNNVNVLTYDCEEINKVLILNNKKHVSISINEYLALKDMLIRRVVNLFLFAELLMFLVIIGSRIV